MFGATVDDNWLLVDKQYDDEDVFVLRLYTSVQYKGGKNIFYIDKDAKNVHGKQPIN